MSIQWYPGHMTKARREIAEAMPLQDVILEVLDARIPCASENPIVAELRGNKPCLKILSKCDLADPVVTEAWIRHLEARSSESGGRIAVLPIRTDRAGETRQRVPELCERLATRRSGIGKTVRAMIVGVPNVGKSTLINTLMDRKVAKVGNEPAVTRGQQQAVLKGGITLSDNPGIMWPKIEDPDAGLRLALAGAIPDSAIDYESVALFGADFLLERYPHFLRARYKLTAMPATGAALLDEIGRRRGCLRSGGVIDVNKAGLVLLHDLRQGTLGRISLEAPGPWPTKTPQQPLAESGEGTKRDAS